MDYHVDLTNIAKEICINHGYKFIEKIGGGGFKETFRVQDDEKIVALKVYKNGVGLDRVGREIEIMTKCDHPNIAKVNKFFECDIDNQNFYCCIEEFLAGGTLFDRTRNTALDREIVLDIGSKLIDTIAYIKQMGLVHRDIKPINILFRDHNWDMVLTDFGIVRDLNDESFTPLYLIRGPGTSGYSPIEQMRNLKSQINWRADQFSAGVTLGVIATNIHPFGWNVDRLIEGKILDEFVVAINQQKLFVILKMIKHWPVQ